MPADPSGAALRLVLRTARRAQAGLEFFMRIHALAAGAVLAALTGAADAACRDDLVKADQNFNRTRSALQQAAAAAPAAKCVAYRRHVASLTEVRSVFARCDTSASKAANA